MGKEVKIDAHPFEEIPRNDVLDIYGHYYAATACDGNILLAGIVYRFRATNNNEHYFHFYIKNVRINGELVVESGKSYKTCRQAYDACLKSMKRAYEIFPAFEIYEAE